jgi:predicted nucleic acid-binding Zn ribbon protein
VKTSACAVCGATITQKLTGRPRLTCSNKCRLEQSRRWRGIMTIRVVVPVWDEDSKSFATRGRVEREHSSGIIDGAAGGILGHVNVRTLRPRSEDAEHQFGHHVRLLDLYLHVFDKPEEQERIRAAARDWLRGPDVLPPGTVPPLERYLNVVVRDLQREAIEAGS